MSEDSHLKTYGITYQRLQYLREAVEGGSYIEPEDVQKLFTMIDRLQNDVLAQMEDKEDAFTDCAAAEDELRRTKNWAANLEHEVLELDQKLKDAEAHMAVLQQIIDWQRWLLDEVEAEDAAKGPTP